MEGFASVLQVGVSWLHEKTNLLLRFNLHLFYCICANTGAVYEPPYRV